VGSDPRGCAVASTVSCEAVIYFGKYELLSRINIGGMAEIVKARDTSVPRERLVAIKRILPHLCDDQQYKAMFLDESRVLAQLEHASIIEAFEIGEIDETPYIALEYIHGQDARALFHETRRGEQRIPIAIACHIIARVCEGLHHAHEQTDASGQLLGIVHRDVSLQNILLSYDGDVKLTDFGIAVSAENVARTDLGVVKGKFGYMSPEQIKGAALDRRSDVFGAGICLYELLTGERLFSGENDYKAVERVRNVDFEPPSALNRQVPSRLERVVMKALAKHPRDRYQSTNDLRRALQSFMAEANEFVSTDDLGAYMRDTFAKELSSLAMSGAQGNDRVTVAQPIADPITGLNAFDDLEPVSSIGFAEHADEVTAVGAGITAVGLPVHTVTLRPPAVGSPVAFGSMPSPARDTARSAPSVPPLIPRSNSIPASAPRAGPTSLLEAGAPVQRFDMDWDEEEPTTVSQGFEDIPKLPAVRSGQITGPLRAPASNEGRAEARVAPLPEAPASGPYSRSMTTLEMVKPPSLISPMLVAGVLGVAALVLVVYLTRDHGVATLRLETEPKDAVVSVDGQHASGVVSPFVISELAAGVNHTILVEKPGYTSWSTRLRVRADKTFELPLVKLLPLQPAAAPARASAEPAAEPAAAVSPTVPRAVSSGESSNSEAARARREAAAARHAERAPSRRTRSHDSPAAAPAVPAATQAAKGGMGTLRINTRPWSQISIDGRPAGNTPQMNLQLKAGSHSVTLTNPEFGVSKTVVIDIKPDATVTRVLTLVP
jgi:serine/threonine protein kinase